MTSLPRTRNDMIAIVREAMQRHRAGDSPDVNEEHLVMLATGRLDELPPGDRARLLRQVAGDAATSQLVAELRSLGLEEPAAAPLPVGGPNWFRATQIVWAIAACLCIALGLWRLADSPYDLPQPAQPIEQMGADDPADPWDALAAERRAEAEAQQWRDIALISAATIWGVVTIPLVIGAIRRRTGKPL